MLKTQRAAHVALMLIFDILALSLAFVVAWLMRDSLGRVIAGTAGLLHIPIHNWVRKPGDMPLFYHILFSGNPLVNFRNHLWVLYLAAPCWLFFLHLQQGYGSVIRNARQKLAMCTYAGLWGMGAFVIFLFLAKMNGVSRLLLVNFLILGTLSLWAARALIVPLIMRRNRDSGHNLLVIGNASAARRLGEMLLQPAYGGSKLLGYVGEDEPQAAGRAGSYS